MGWFTIERRRKGQLRLLARFDRAYRHRLWHSQYPELYWLTNGMRNDSKDFVCCPFCHKKYWGGVQ